MVDTKIESNNSENVPEKTARQLQKEAKKMAKLEKFKQKQEKKETDKPIKVKETTEVRALFIAYRLFSEFQAIVFVSIWYL